MLKEYTKDIGTKKSISNISKFFAIIMLLLVVILILVKKFVIGNMDGFLDTIITNVAGVLITLIIFNCGYEYLTREDTANYLAGKITEAIMGNQNLIDRLTNDTKNDYLRNILKSRLPDGKGQTLYQLIEPYYDSKIEWRQHFEYIINLQENTTYELEWSAFFTVIKNYYFIHEDLTFTKTYRNNSIIADSENLLWIGFLLKESDLHKPYPDKIFVFKEILSINNADWERIKLNDGQDVKAELINELMKVQLFTDNTEDQYKYWKKLNIKQIYINDDGIFISYIIPKEIDIQRSNWYNINFTLPQVKEKNRFLAILSDPTCNPIIRFHYPCQQIIIEAIPFFDKSYERIPEKPASEGVKEIELLNWVLPTSGVVFMWNEKNDKNDNQSDANLN